MVIDLIYLFLTFFLTFLLYPLWIRFLYAFHLRQNEREEQPKDHLLKQGTPTMGGFVFILTVAFITFLLNRSRTQTLFPLLVASMAGLFGLIEDFSNVYRKSGLPSFFQYYRAKLKAIVPNKKKTFLLWAWFKEFGRVVGSKTDFGLQTHQKIIIEIAIGGFVAIWTYFKLGWDYIWLPLIGDVHIGILYPIFIFGMFILVLNCVAFTDGLDGLAGGLALIAFVAFWAIAYALKFYSLATFCATFVGALLPFLYFNVYPARMFMGNVGSHVLGAVLVLLGIVMHREIVVFIICAIFLVDGITSPLQQISVKLTKKRLFRMAPIHHHFELLGWPETKVTMRFWLFGGFFAFLGVLVALL
jgi:phospho-N-acetylmuramoyl-pentapeptide-transferase